MKIKWGKRKIEFICWERKRNKKISIATIATVAVVAATATATTTTAATPPPPPKGWVACQENKKSSSSSLSTLAVVTLLCRSISFTSLDFLYRQSSHTLVDHHLQSHSSFMHAQFSSCHKPYSFAVHFHVHSWSYPLPFIYSSYVLRLNLSVQI